MTTTRQLVDRVRGNLLSGHRPRMNRLDGDLAAASETVTLKYDQGEGTVVHGDVLAIGLELVHVWVAAQGSLSLTVQRGVEGSAAADHLDGTTVYVNAPFSDFAIFQAINSQLRSLSGEGVFHVKTKTLTWNSGISGYDLSGADDMLSVIDVSLESGASTLDWPRLERAKWRLTRDLPSTAFASTLALFVYGGYSNGKRVQVSYRAPFAQLASLTDDVEAVTGLKERAHDILVYGAAAALVAPTEVKRNMTEAQGRPREASEVPPGARFNSARGLLLLKDQHLRAERKRLLAEHPLVLS